MRTETKVGLAVLLAFAALSYMTFKIGGLSFGEKGYRLFVIFPDIAGLTVRAPVQMSGVEIGEVEQIDLVDGGARLTLRIRPGIELHAGVSAALKASGLLGGRFVAILQGKEKERIKEGAILSASAGERDIEQLAGQASDLIARFSHVADNINRFLEGFQKAFPTEGESAMTDIVTHFRSLSSGIDSFVSKNQASMGQSIANLEAFTAFLNKEGNALLRDMTQITQKIARGEGTVGRLIHDQGAYDRFSGLLDDLGQSLKDIEVITDRMQRGEGTFGKLLVDDSAYRNFNTALEGVSDTLGRIKRFKTEVGFRNEYQFSENENKGYVSVSLSPQRDKYYLIEAVDDPLGETTLTRRLNTVNGVPTTLTELETRRALKFSALLGKRLPHLGLRMGLMENTFGVGTDLYLQDDAFKLSLDAWEFSSDDPLSDAPRLKVTAQYELLRHIHFSVGMDQMLNANRETVFAGIGLRFEDDDLKYLLGGFSGVAK